MRDTILKAALAATVLLLATTPTWAGTQARVAGVVLNSNGKPVPDVTITVSCPELPAYKKVLEADSKGRFKLLILDATKQYIFHTEASGYAAHDEPVKVGIATTDNFVEIRLKSKQEVLEQQQAEAKQQPGIREYEEGSALLAAGDREAARAKFEEAVAAMPNLEPAWRSLAQLEFDGGDFESALDTARSCLEADDESISCLAIAANSAAALGDEATREAYLSRYQELNPEDPAAIFNQAAERLNAMDDEGARPLLEQCLAVDSEFPKCLFEYGMLLLRSGDMEGAKAQLEKLIEVDPDGPDAATARETVKYL